MAEWAAIFGGTGAALVTELFAGCFQGFAKKTQTSTPLICGGWMTFRIASVKCGTMKEVRRRQDDHLEWHAENG